MATIRESSTSRLVQNSENIRSKLNARNVYGIDVQYPTKSDSVSNKILDSINGIKGVLTPYSGYDIRNTVFGRAIEDRTPLTEIGLIMLGKQFAMNYIKRGANQTIPIIKPSNLLPWRDGKLITTRKNLSITIDKDKGGFQRFLEKTIHFYPNSANPFTKNPTNLDYLKNTGKSQLDFLYSNINNNLFTSSEIRIFAGEDNVPTRVQNLAPNRFYFTKSGGRTKDFHPYISLNYLTVLKGWEIEANLAMQESLEYLADSHPDYGADLYYINDALGNSQAQAAYFDKSHLTEGDDNYINPWVDTDTGFSDDYLPNKIVWGRDGITETTDTELSELRGIEESSFGDTTDILKNKFNVRAGLLEYTRNLINANGGHVGDITRKVFTKNNKITAFNGNSLWQAPSTALERFRDKVGLRQHSVIDQYGTFAKAIRFDGNQVYNGNPDSVVYKSVLPKIHPTLSDDGILDVKNMMFAIENLAIETKADYKENVGTIEDEYGTKIPITEVGGFGGRVMWFPPYNLEFTETHAANFESTVMVGRNEPMYNYLHSERAGTIRFSLIIDYPPQLKEYKGIDKHKKIAEFFAFGSTTSERNQPDIDRLLLREKELENAIDELKPKPKVIDIPNLTNKEIKISFENDFPTTGQIQTVFDNMYENAYEISKRIALGISPVGEAPPISYGLNEHIYYLQGVIKMGNSWVFNSGDLNSTYTFNPMNTGLTSQLELTENLIVFNGRLYTKLDYMLLQAYNNVENRKLFKIKIESGASKRYFDQSIEEKYNFELAKRRSEATKNFLNTRLKVLFGKDAAGLGIQFDLGGIDGTGSFGSINASPENITDERINALETKNERYSLIQLQRTSYVPEPEQTELTSEDQQRLTTLQEDLDKVRRLIQQAKKRIQLDIFDEKRAIDVGAGTSDAGKSSNFQNVAQNYYAPVFHSQTPEDFHRRLTFLHQCMRQGSAQRQDIEIDNTGTARARNSVFGRQPICVLRIGDFFYTKIIIENLTIDYDDAPWDTNPEGFGMQPMIANVTLNIKIMGGQSLRGPINVLQNAVSFNYYANSTFTDKGMYKTPSVVAAVEEGYRLSPDEIKNDDKKVKSYEDILKIIENKRKESIREQNQ